MLTNLSTVALNVCALIETEARMRRATPLTVSILAAGVMVGCGAQPVDIAAETEAVRARSDAIVAAESAQNVEETLAFYTDDAVVQPPGAPQVQGKEAIANLYRQFGGFESGQLKEFSGTRSHLEVSAAGDLAYEYGVNRMVLVGPEGDLVDMGKYLAVWEKVGGDWYIAALSFTSDAPAPGSGT
jgi:ketosteroid isomerase-like protein